MALTVGGPQPQLRIGSSGGEGITSTPPPSPLHPNRTDTSGSNKRASGPWQAANPIPAGQQSVWLVAPAGM